MKHADEAANTYEIFIRPAEAVQLVRENKAQGAATLHGCLPPSTDADFGVRKSFFSSGGC